MRISSGARWLAGPLAAVQHLHNGTRAAGENAGNICAVLARVASSRECTQAGQTQHKHCLAVSLLMPAILLPSSHHPGRMSGNINVGREGRTIILGMGMAHWPHTWHASHMPHCTALPFSVAATCHTASSSPSSLGSCCSLLSYHARSGYIASHQHRISQPLRMACARAGSACLARLPRSRRRRRAASRQHCKLWRFRCRYNMRARRLTTAAA